MAAHIHIRKTNSVWVARTSDAIIAESSNALELSETGQNPVIYFPREDVAMAFLDPTDHTTHCPHKGDARYFSISGPAGDTLNAAWSYETPHPDAAEIAGHLAFYPTHVTVEKL